MTTIATIQREHTVIRKWQTAVAEAALPFEARWTLAALRRVDRDLHRRLLDQRNLFDQALVTGTAQDIEVHGAALCRGYAIAIQALERVAEPDNAYMLGQDVRSGFRVAIGSRRLRRSGYVKCTAIRWCGSRRMKWRPLSLTLRVSN